MRIAPRHRQEWLVSPGGFGEVSRPFEGRHRSGRIVRIGYGDPIVLVPGLAGGRELLEPLARKLAGRYEVILPDLQGDQGAQTGRPIEDVADLADDLAGSIASLGLERPLVMGVSFGAAVALEYAIAHPERVGGLVLWGGEARFESSLGTTIARRALERFPLPSDNRFLNSFFNILHGGRPEPGPLVDFIVDRCWRTEPSVIARRLALLESFDVADRLWRVDAPTLVMAGSRDVVITPTRQRALADAISAASYVEVEGAGHVGFLTHRAEVARHLAAFVGKVRESSY